MANVKAATAPAQSEAQAAARPKVTYRPLDGDPMRVRWRGVELEANVPRDDLPDDLIEEAKRWPWLRVEGHKQATNTEPTDSDQYRAYAVDWFKKETDADHMERRWSEEQAMRDKRGVGSDDIEYLMTLYVPRLAELKKAAA